MKAEYKTSVKEIIDICNGRLLNGDSDKVIDTITSDSRELGKDSLFVALIGEKFNGHDFIETLCVEKKIKAFLTMSPKYREIADKSDIAAILCDDTLNALGLIGAKNRDDINPRMVGITGTNGKTTTKEILHKILSNKYNTLKNEKNYNNEIGVPFTLMKLHKGHEVAVIEMGMNHAGELDRLSKITRPDISVITNVGEGHLEFLGSIENVAYAKSEIMNGMKKGSKLILNSEMQCSNIVFEKAKKMDLEIKTFGLRDDADVCPDSYSLMTNGIELLYKGNKIYAPLYGLHNLINLMAAVAVADEFGIGPKEINQSLSDFDNIEGRSAIIDMGYIVIDDTYNSNPLSARYALESASMMFPGRRKIAVLSDMKELGEASEYYHQEIGKEVHKNKFDFLYLWGNMSGVFADGAMRSGMDKEKIKIYDSKEDLSQELKQIISENDLILVKGSRSMKMEEIVKTLSTRSID